MQNGQDYLALKWGTLKAWDLKSAAAQEAGQAYFDGGVSASAMLQEDTAEQIEALCDLIDAIDGPIINEWSGDRMTKEAAKAYVREYKRPYKVKSGTAAPHG